MVPVAVSGRIVAPGFVLGESPGKALDKAFLSYGLHKARNILRDKEGKLPGIPFHVLLVGSAPERVKVRGPVSQAVLHVGEPVLIQHMPPPGTALVKHAESGGIPKAQGQLAHRPVIEGVFQGIGEASFVRRDVSMLQVDHQVPVAGKALVHLLPRGGLHLHGSPQRLVPVKIPDSHLPGAHDERNLVLGHHHGNIVEPGGSLSQPSAGPEQRKLRLHKLAGPLGRHQVPQLIEVPECIPEGIAA